MIYDTCFVFCTYFFNKITRIKHQIIKTMYNNNDNDNNSNNNDNDNDNNNNNIERERQR